jgi:hypothetical protein
MGTPKSLDEAIAIILATTNSQNIREYPYIVLKDFLAQKFGAAMLVAGDDENLVAVLESLFETITRRAA